jgi:uncharacterized protein (DUF362 family)
VLRDCSTYDVDLIEQLAGDALDLLELRPFGRTLVKPNVVMSGEKFPHSHTRVEFVEGVVRALQRRDDGVTELAVGERSGISMPTRYAFKGAGFNEMFDRTGVEYYHFDEETQVEIPLSHKGRLRDRIYVPEPVAKADFFVNVPKFKAHPWTTVTFGMKNYIGIQDDRHRLIDHDHLLNEKVRDLQFVLQPQFCAIDAIIAGEGRMLTPLPFDMGLAIFGNDQLAFDAVCCHIIGIDPLSVDHLRLAHEAGFGTVDLAEIDIEGDLSLTEAQQRAEGFRVGLIRIEDYFADNNISAYAGPPPATDSVDAAESETADLDYCWGGCPGAMQEAIELIRLFDEETDAKMPITHIVFGAYDGEIDAKADERVVFIGDCTSFAGEISGQKVDIRSVYQDRSTKEPLEAKHTDMFARMAKTNVKFLKERNDQIVELRGCPVSVAEQLLALVSLGGLKNPFLDPAEATRFGSSYLSWRTQTAIKRVRRHPYVRAGEAPRGKAATVL